MEQLPKIVRQRLLGKSETGVHPDPDLLAAFAENSLKGRERSQVLQHLAQCTHCRDVLALAMPETEPVAVSSIPKTSSWLSWPRLRWGALAACLVVVSAAVTLRYEWRQSGEASVAKKNAPAASSMATSGPEQPGEEPAAKAQPPAQFQERDLGAIGMVAKQNSKGLNAGTIAAGAPALAALDQAERAREFNNDRLAKAIAPRSANEPAPPAAALVAAAPPPAPAAKAAAASQASGSRDQLRSDSANYRAGGEADAMTVAGASPSIAKTAPAPTPERKAKDESTAGASQNEVQAAGAGAVIAGAQGGRSVSTLSGAVAQAGSGDNGKRSRISRNAARWTLTGEGALQRSFDSGKTWQTIPVAGNVIFRTLAANDSDVWVGGAAGVLYHSIDAGQHWVQVKPVADGKPLTADIATVEFSDAEHGKLTTGNGETWATSDAGATWQKY